MSHNKNNGPWWNDWTGKSTFTVPVPALNRAPQQLRCRRLRIVLVALASCFVLPVGVFLFGAFVSDPFGLVWTFGAGYPEWSPDGKQIVFRCDQEDVYDGAVCVRRADRDERHLIRPWSGYYNGIYSTWSPDGKKILSSGFGVRVFNPDGTDEQELSRSGWGAVWSPDGTKIAFLHKGVLVMNGDGSDKQRLVVPVNLQDPGSVLTWAPDGKHLLYQDSGRFSGRPTLFVLDADGKAAPRRLGRGEEAVWSPDGKHVAFTQDNSIWLMNADGSDRRRLTMGTRDGSPRWSPSGKSLVYVRDGYDVCLLYPDEGTIHFVAHGKDPAFSPDGKRLAFVNNSGEGGFSRVRVIPLGCWAR